MTMHAAKGLEFKVVVCAGLGRAGNRQHPDVLLDGDRVGLRLMGLDGSSRPALDYEALADDRKARERAEERRVLHVAMTRAEERLILSGACTLGEKWPKPSHGAAPLSWLGPELLPDVATAVSVEAPELTVAVGDHGGAVRAVLNAPGTVGRVLADPLAAAPRDATRPPAARDASSPPAAVAEQLGAPPTPPAAAPSDDAGQLSFDFAAPARTAPRSRGRGARARRPAAPAAATLSYSSLVDHAACGYRAYLRRTLRLGEVEPPPHLREDAARGPDARLRGTIVHEVLETADLRPGAPAPDADAVRAVAADHDAVLSDEALADVLGAPRGPSPAATSARGSPPRAPSSARRPSPCCSASPIAPRGHPPRRCSTASSTSWRPSPTGRRWSWTTRPTARPATRTSARSWRATTPCSAPRTRWPACAPATRPWRSSHLYLERAGEPVAVRHVAADAPALEGLLLDAARPLLDGDHRPAAAPYAGLCARCPGRGGLCSWPTSMTDRPDPEAPPVGGQAP